MFYQVRAKPVSEPKPKPATTDRYLRKLEVYWKSNEIPKSAFIFSQITNLIFPKSSMVKKIGPSAFTKSYSLEFVSINETVEIIGQKCFYECKNLTKFQIEGESHLRIIGDSAFELTRLKEFEFPNSIKKLGNYSVNYLKEYDLSKTKIQVFNTSFYSGESVVLMLPNTIRRLSIYNIFQEIKVEDGGKYFVSNNGYVIAKFQPTIFSVAKKRKSYFIRRGIERINDFAFCHARMRVICFPSSLKEIGRQAFERCENLEKIKFANPSSLVKICEYAFCFCKKLKEVRFPSSLVDLCDHAFDQCLNLSFVSFPSDSKLKTIGDHVFFCCKVEGKVKLPPKTQNTRSEYSYIDNFYLLKINWWEY